MFITVDEIAALTRVTTTQDVVNMAQAIIEAYTGKLEVEVTDAEDLMWLGRATAYQAAYMQDGNMDVVFNQMGVSQITQFGSSVTFPSGGESPFVAPLAILSCKRLSWKSGTRSVRTGKIIDPVRGSWLAKWVTD